MIKKVSFLNRAIVILVGHIAGYKVVNGMEPYSELTTLYYTIGFGTIVLVALLMMMFGLKVLMNDWVMIMTAFIPVGLSLGLVNQFLPSINYLYLVISIVGIIAVILTRRYKSKKNATLTTSLVHGASGLIVVLLPIYLVMNNLEKSSILFVSLGGIILGSEGILKALQKMERKIISEDKLNNYFPLLLLLASTAFVVGLYYL